MPPRQLSVKGLRFPRRASTVVLLAIAVAGCVHSSAALRARHLSYWEALAELHPSAAVAEAHNETEKEFAEALGNLMDADLQHAEQRFGKLRRTGPMLWTMPLPANIVLRNFGLAMFLATVGVNAGQPFVRTVAESGFTMLFIGVAVLLTTVFIVLLVGHYILKIPYDDLMGVASGATGNPAILVYSTKMAPTERPDIGYAMIFPSMTLVKVIAAQIVGLLMVGGSAG